MEKKSIEEFRKKIREAVHKLQTTLPNPLTKEEEVSITALINIFAAYTIESGCGGTFDLLDLIGMPISEYEDNCIDENKDNTKEYDRYIETIEEIIKNSPPLLSSSKNEQEIAEKIPYLHILIDDDLKIVNHASQFLYSTDKNDKVINDYFVKSHAQHIRDIGKEKSDRLEDITI